MTVALGASAYSAGIFHLMTHAFFKALLFLAAGSVIIAMHHEQDMRRMGGLKKYMPITYWTFLVGALALIGFPGTAGFFSKDLLIDAEHAAHRVGSSYAYFCVLTGIFITALYTFRMFFMTFHGPERMDQHVREHLHESPKVVTVPLILLAIPSALIGWFTVKPLLFGGYFDGAIQVLPAHEVLKHLGEEFHTTPAPFSGRPSSRRPLWIALAGVFAAWLFFYKKAGAGGRRASARSSGCTPSSSTSTASIGSTSMSSFRARGVWALGLWQGGDETLIDNGLVNGSARIVGWLGAVVRYAQSGYLYHYAFAMILGLASLLLWLMWRP